MTIADFWHRAFASALARLPADEAKGEADRAVELAIEHWDAVMKERGQIVQVWMPYAQLDITDTRQPGAR